MATASTRKLSAKSDAAKANPFHQRLARLTHYQACQVLGETGAQLISRGSQLYEVDTDRDVYLGGDLYRVRVCLPGALQPSSIVTVTLQSARDKQVQINCDQCDSNCEHMGAALAHMLEAKITMGLSAPPDEVVPLELLTDEELIRRAMAEREKRAKEESMWVRWTDKSTPWADYVVTSELSGKTYRVALRGTQPGQSYCSCPDFRTNHLGTCKHILRVIQKLGTRFSKSALKKPYERRNISVRLSYVPPVGLLFNMPTKLPAKATDIIEDSGTVPVDGVVMMNKIQALEQGGLSVHVYPDAEEAIQRDLTIQRLAGFTAKIRKNPKQHPLLKKLLKVPLLPYQLDGIAFAVGAGRAILADDMGLGKTIQAVGVAELLAREADIRRVLVICPASLKSQWASEIQRFSNRTWQLVIGSGEERVSQYRGDAFFTICNYEQVMRDLTHIESAPWDLIILDEGQRIKNWMSTTSQVVRSLRSTFALVLSGTPLENRLDELYTVVKFVDDARLGPAYRFFHQHRMVDDRGKPVGYRNLDKLREALKPILLRRTRDEVVKQLPDRTDEVVLIEPTQEQWDISNGHLQRAAQIAAKKFLTEMDLLLLQKSLLMARMAADSTFLVDKQEPEYSSKLARLNELLAELLAEPDRKIILFSEWRTMLDRIEAKLDTFGCDYVRLDGQVPQKRRAQLVRKFQTDPNCRVILMTNAGSTGLNLQAANTVINVDLPWNPAVLEQRIARAHRMGQKNPVHVYKLVTTKTIEERLLDTIASKQDLADAAINMDSDVAELTMKSSISSIRERLEKILIPQPSKPLDVSQQRRVEEVIESIEQRKQRVSAATGQLLGAALQLVGELVGSAKPEPAQATVDQFANRLSECVERDAENRPQLTISLPDDNALRALAQSLAKLLSPS